MLGIALRLSTLLQSRDLIIDEANLARNLYERDFTALATPLSYEQYAPPVFLWIAKLCTIAGGFGEVALRFYPFLCGSALLLLFVRTGRQLGLSRTALLYPLLLLAGGEIYLRYSTELKQYMPDALICLGLVSLALKTHAGSRGMAFYILWTAAGSLALWSSMPAVFVLATIGVSFGWKAVRRRQPSELAGLAVVAVLWLLQFWLYYETILKAQIGSSYLQNFHAPFFLHPTVSGTGLAHNLEVLGGWLGAAWGHWALSMILNGLLLLAGIVRLHRRKPWQAFLLLIPVLLMLTAALLHQYSLIHRLTLFSMPLLLLGVAAGADWLLSLRHRAIPAVLALPAAICVINFCQGRWLYAAPQYEPVQACMQHAQSFRPQRFYVMETAKPAVIYYSKIHPGQERYAGFRTAVFLEWATNYDTIPLPAENRIAVLSNRTEPALHGERMAKLKGRMQEIAFFEQLRCSSAVLQAAR